MLRIAGFDARENFWLYGDIFPSAFRVETLFREAVQCLARFGEITYFAQSHMKASGSKL